jgi:rod shape-determining protein MreD
MVQFFQYAIIAILLTILQTTIVPFAGLQGVTPDLVLIYIIIISLREGQMTGTVAGFAIGLLGDFAAGDFIGLGALTKTIAGFIAGYFYNETSPIQSLGTSKFLWAVVIAGGIHNLIHHLFLLQGFSMPLNEILIKFVLGTTLYTLAISLVPMLQYSSRLRAARVKG